MGDNQSVITRSCIDNVVSFIPSLESLPEDDIARWPDQGTGENGSAMLSLEPEYAPKIRVFIKAIHDNNFVQPFDWEGWQVAAESIVRNPKKLSNASLSTCAKLLTLHVRKDRFCGGHFGEMVRCGHITSILKRLVSLRPTATAMTLYYPKTLLRDWKLGRVHPNWYRQFTNVWCERDLSNVEGQCHLGYHFAEWFTTLHFLRQGYDVLTSKYLHSSRPKKRQKAIELLGERNVAFLLEKRVFNGCGLRNPPRPDLLVFKSDPKTISFVEVKRETDTLSRPQREFFPMIEKELGCEVLLVKLKVRDSE